MNKYVIGVDFGSLSGRAVIADVKTGEIKAMSVYEYPHGVMSEYLPDGTTALPSDYALQHPKDYLEVLENTIPAVLEESGIEPENVAGVGIDFTVCSPLPVKNDGTPLCFLPEFAHEKHAYVKLWKHHAAAAYSKRINELAIKQNAEWLKRYGGSVSSEWFFPKLCQIAEEAPDVYDETDRFIEAGDWIAWMLTGKESHCAAMAGFKAMWNEKDGYVPNDFLKEICPKLDGAVGTKVSENISPVGSCVGEICEYGAKLTGLKIGTPVAAAMCDAPCGLPGSGISKPGEFFLVIGTSSCHILLSDKLKNVEGMCGCVRDGIIPGYLAYESGQCCTGDVFDWFNKNCVPASYAEKAKEQGVGLHKYLRDKAKVLKPGQSGLIALDWWNGNRSVLDDQSLSGLILGMTLSTKPEEIYRALIESTAFGTKMIIDSYEKAGIAVDEIIAAGGIAEKDEMLMQIYADVTGRKIRISGTKQSVAMGSAVYAAAASGEYKTVSDAVNAMIPSGGITYSPISENVEKYKKLYDEYVLLHDCFGRGANDAMKRLKALKGE